MEPTTDERLRKADREVTMMKRRLRHDLQQAGISDRQAETIERTARNLGTAVASLCIEVERMAEQEGWHE